MSDFTRIAAGAALPPLGEGAVCDYCAARGLCRKDFWGDEAPLLAKAGASPSAEGELSAPWGGPAIGGDTK